jgi:hypothetical protein
MPRTSKEHFKIFVDECQRWIDFYGLNDWHFYFRHSDKHKENLAYTAVEHKSKSAVIFMTITWAKDDLFDGLIELSAHHEVCEVMNSKLRDLATSRYVTSDEEIDEANHEIITRLQNSVFKRRHLLTGVKNTPVDVNFK